jgi:hypothetical protein
MTTHAVSTPTSSRADFDKRLNKTYPTSSLVSFEKWLQEMAKTPATGWRWRQRGWIRTVNICGRLYLSREEILNFERRAAAGEFAKTHRTPSSKGVAK